jgi:hypothetical protein
VLIIFKPNVTKSISVAYNRQITMVSFDTSTQKIQPNMSNCHTTSHHPFDMPERKKIFHDNCQKLIEYKQKHGHIDVPVKYPEDEKLGKWVKKWKTEYRRYKKMNGKIDVEPKINLDRMKALERIGFNDWYTSSYKPFDSPERNQIFHDMCLKLVEYKHMHGHMDVPAKYNEDPKFGYWVKRWKTFYRKYRKMNGQRGVESRIHYDRIRALERIGFNDDTVARPLRGSKRKPVLDVKSYQKIALYKWRHVYRKWRMSSGVEGDPVRMKRLEDFGVVDDIMREMSHVTKASSTSIPPTSMPYSQAQNVTKSIGMFDDIIGDLNPILESSSISPTFACNTQNISNEEMSSSMSVNRSTRMNKQKDSEIGGVCRTQACLDSIGSELSGKGGFWV